MATVKLQNGKVILNDGKVSCECCCIIDINKLRIPQQRECEMFFGKICGRCGPPPENIKICPELDPEYNKCLVWPTLPCSGFGERSSGLLGVDAYESPYRGRYSRRDACLRFFYRIVNEYAEENGLVISEGETASGARSLKSGIELWLPYREDKANLFEGESCGLYIYAFYFKYWSSVCSGSPITGYRPGGAQPPTCKIRDYNVDMFTCVQYGPYSEWNPQCPN